MHLIVYRCNEPPDPRHEQVKTIVATLCALLSLLTISQVRASIVIGGSDGLDPDDSTVTYPVVLALSGGGARGLAGAGVFKAFEEKGIRTTAIAGTSIGGIIGGLYACGFNADQLRQIIEAIDFSQLFTNEPPRATMLFTQRRERERHLLSVRFDGLRPQIPHALTGGQELTSLLARLTLLANYRAGGDFNKLKIPFKTVCTDVVSGREVVLDTGSLADAMRATMAFPLAFTGVEQGNKLLMDGGIVMPVPVSIARRMCGIAPCVVAVNTTSPLLTKSGLSTPVDIANQVTTIMSANELSAQLSQADFVITPELDGLSSTDFDLRDSIISLGRRAGLAMADTIIDSIRRLIDTTTLEIGRVSVMSGDTALSAKISARLNGQKFTEADLTFELKSLARHEHLYRLEATFDSTPSEQFARVSNSRLVHLMVHIQPAPRCADVALDIRGVTQFPADSIRAWLFSGDSLLTPTGLKRGLDSVIRRYSAIEFDLATVRQSRLDVSGRTLTIDIDEGIVRRIDVLQNRKTRDWVVRSYFPVHRDEPFSSEKAVRGMGEVFGTDLFDRVTIHVVPMDGGAAVMLTVRERQSLQVRLGWHWDNRYQSEEFLELLNDNIFGTGVEYLLHAQYGLDRQSYYGELKADRIFSTYLTAQTRAGFDRTIRTTFDLNNKPDGTREETKLGLALNVGQQIIRLGTVTAGVSVERLRYDDRRFPVEAFTLNSVNLESEVETFDRVPFPTAGRRHYLQIRLAREYLRSDRNFTRFFSTFEAYYTLATGLTYHPVISLGLSRDGLPASERFYLGGMHSLTGLRYEGINGDKCILLNQELRYRIIPRVYVTARFDAGNVYDRLDQLKLTGLRHGVGLALALDTPIGPIEFAYGHANKDEERLYFSAGLAF
jgi:NTE family protein